jgi:hypothetical protein
MVAWGRSQLAISGGNILGRAEAGFSVIAAVRSLDYFTGCAVATAKKQSKIGLVP